MDGIAFVWLPGASRRRGTLEEFFEVWTWAQLGLHRKPCALLNLCGYFDALLEMLDRMIQNGFMMATYRQSLIVECAPEPLIERLLRYSPPPEKWADFKG